MTEPLSVAQGRLYGDPLQAASYRGDDQVVQMLLDRGANVNAQGGEYGNALQAASSEGHDQVVHPDTLTSMNNLALVLSRQS